MAFLTMDLIYFQNKINQTKGQISIKHITSSIVSKQLNDLKSQYRIQHKNRDHNNVEKIIELANKTNTNDIDSVYEKFIRLNILEPKLKTYILDLDGPSFKKQHPTIPNNLGKRNEQYIERDSVNRLDELRLKQLESQKFICVHGETGTGKKEFAIEYGWRVCTDYCVRVFHFETIERDFRHLAQILGAQVNANATKDLVENIAFRLSELNNRNFLFIILDVLDFKSIEIYLQEQLLSLENVKFLFTTPHENLLPNAKKSLKIKLDLFSRDEANAYFERFYARRPKLDEKQKWKIFELGLMKRAG
jgi:DNA replication protein DnaC